MIVTHHQFCMSQAKGWDKTTRIHSIDTCDNMGDKTIPDEALPDINTELDQISHYRRDNKLYLKSTKFQHNAVKYMWMHTSQKFFKSRNISFKLKLFHHFPFKFIFSKGIEKYIPMLFSFTWVIFCNWHAYILATVQDSGCRKIYEGFFCSTSDLCYTFVTVHAVYRYIPTVGCILCYNILGPYKWHPLCRWHFHFFSKIHIGLDLKSSLFQRTISQHCSREWLGTDQASIPYMDYVGGAVC